MRADEFALLLNARRAGAGRWFAKCPAHDDSSPSLSIAEGCDGRVLLCCFAGCRLDFILAALKLGRRDLFQGPPLSPEQVRAASAARYRAEEETRSRRLAHGKLCDQLHTLERTAEAMAAQMMQAPDDATEGAATVFHGLQDRIRELDAKEQEARA